MKKTVEIDHNRCISCLGCVSACGHGVLRQRQGEAYVDPAKSCFLCLHCAAVCPQRAISVPGISERELYEQEYRDDFEKRIMTRRSVRSYRRDDGEPLRQLVVRALEVAQWSPNARNAREIKWLVVWGHERVAALADGLIDKCRRQGYTELVREYRQGVNPAVFGAPCLILAAAPDESYDPPVDCAIATTTLELLLNNAGLGTCWAGYFLKLARRFPEVMAALGLAQGWDIYCALCTGRPTGDMMLRVPWRAKPDSIWNV